MDELRVAISNLEEEKERLTNNSNISESKKRKLLSNLNSRISLLRNNEQDLILKEQLRNSHNEPQNITNDEFERENNQFSFNFSKSPRVSTKSQRKSSKSPRASRKSQRKSSKSPKVSRKSQRKSSKSPRASRKSQRKSSKSSRK